MPAQLEYCCPLCKGDLTSSVDSYSCAACAKTYPIVWGIPDFRVFPDPYISIEDDHRKGLRVAEHYNDRDFKGLAEFYWSITPDTPDHLVKRYMRYDLAGVERGRAALDGIARAVPDLRAGAGCRAIELGCRTGGFLVALAERFEHAVGIDIAFRWLIVAKKRLEERGLSAQLVCCCAQYLPFREKQFDLVVAANVIEHSQQQQQIIDDAHRVLRPKGVFHAITVSRFSAAPEPHVRLWGVGWLPRKWMAAYVRLRRGVPYDNVRLVSYFELRCMVRRSPFARCRLRPPAFGEGEQEGFSPMLRRMIGLYNAMRNWPLVRQFLLLFGPLLELICLRGDA